MAADQEKEQLQHNLKVLLDDIQKRAEDAGRKSDEIQLVVVTKEKPALVIKQLTELGQLKIGESYLQEALFKMELLADIPVEWHMIGHIQHGKERQVVRHFDVVHSIDRLSLAQKMNQEAEKAGRQIPVFAECNVSGEETKYGFPAWKDQQWNQLVDQIGQLLEMEQLPLKGLMTMAPYARDPEKTRPYFSRLRDIRDQLQKEFPRSKLTELSMGMSGDYRVAVEEGATYLRIGSAVVGPR